MMERIQPKVYISSTFEDLELHRRAAREQLEKLGLKVVSMETYTAEDRRSLERCLEDIRNSDLYIGIFAWCYGSVPSGHNHSYTELEYREAGRQGMERLIFLVDPNAHWPPKHIDALVSGDGTLIQRLRDELEQTHLCDSFSTPESLASALSAAVQSFLERRVETAAAFKRGESPAAAAIRDYAQSILDELGSELDSHYVPLQVTIEGHDKWISAGPHRRLCPPSFAVVDRSLVDLPSSSGWLSQAELAVDRFRQFVILGAPGAGKTTFLQSLAVRACRRLLSEPDTPVPLHIRLTQWPESVTDLGSLIVHERTVQALQLVPTRRLMLLFDELNELDSRSYRQKLEAIETWIVANPSVSVVVASRDRHYEAGPKLSLPTARLHALDDNQVENFIRNYLGGQAEALLAELIWEPKGIEAARRLAHLARNPYILRLLCQADTYIDHPQS